MVHTQASEIQCRGSELTKLVNSLLMVAILLHSHQSKLIFLMKLHVSPLLDPFDNMTVKNWFINYEFQTLTV